jgi:hypothetical protein
MPGVARRMAQPTPAAIQKQRSGIMFALHQDPGMRTKLTDGGYDEIDVTLDEIPAFLAEKSRAYIEDAKAAALLK